MSKTTEERIDETERLIAHLAASEDTRDQTLLTLAREHRVELIHGNRTRESRLADLLTPFYVAIARIQVLLRRR